MSTDAIRQNLADVLARIARATTAAGRRPGSVRLVAVSKTLPADRIREAFDSGQRVFGENRVQELEVKAPVLPAECEWHMIGHLQKNKVRMAVRCAAWIHSVDSESLLDRIDRIAAEDDRSPRVLLQVNVSGEDSKSGVSPDDLPRLLERALACEHVPCCGLMTMAPFGADPGVLHRVFANLRERRDRLADEFGCALPELSMGMSQDFEIAIREGATLVRVGTAVFGARH